nr:MAG TPA: hypothetical protein [Caudoviricetes sp.]
MIIKIYIRQSGSHHFSKRSVFLLPLLLLKSITD